MSFDIKAAREICSRVKGYEDPDGGNFADFQAAEMLPAALDEIEQQANHIAEQSSGIKKLKENLSECWQVHDEQAKRIAELEEALVEERAHCYLNLERNADIVTWDLDEVSENEQKRLRYEAREQLRQENKL